MRSQTQTERAVTERKGGHRHRQKGRSRGERAVTDTDRKPATDLDLFGEESVPGVQVVLAEGDGKRGGPREREVGGVQSRGSIGESQRRAQLHPHHLGQRPARARRLLFAVGLDHLLLLLVVVVHDVESRPETTRS